jgi:hypothetical protein
VALVEFLQLFSDNSAVPPLVEPGNPADRDKDDNSRRNDRKEEANANHGHEHDRQDLIGNTTKDNDCDCPTNQVGEELRRLGRPRFNGSKTRLAFEAVVNRPVYAAQAVG